MRHAVDRFLHVEHAARLCRSAEQMLRALVDEIPAQVAETKKIGQYRTSPFPISRAAMAPRRMSLARGRGILGVTEAV